MGMRHDTSIAPRDSCHSSVSDLFDASIPAPVMSGLLIFTLRFVCRRIRYGVPLCHVLIIRTHGLVRARGESASQALTRSTSAPSPHDAKPPPGGQGWPCHLDARSVSTGEGTC
jgi:hypothetical protein